MAMTRQESRVWFVTGSTSGFGRALVEAAREELGRSTAFDA
jgi:NAD(P)-dependent dehydrogenase (short-subunit alcohol dehydrogenase family)